MVVPSQPWHARSPESIWVDLKTDAQGLSAAEAARRQQQLGATLLPPA
ncbi:MAG: cation-transporting P-type ATPase, partial [Vulcanococcus sp.]